MIFDLQSKIEEKWKCKKKTFSFECNTFCNFKKLFDKSWLAFSVRSKRYFSSEIHSNFCNQIKSKANQSFNSRKFLIGQYSLPVYLPLFYPDIWYTSNSSPASKLRSKFISNIKIAYTLFSPRIDNFLNTHTHTHTGLRTRKITWKTFLTHSFSPLYFHRALKSFPGRHIFS